MHKPAKVTAAHILGRFPLQTEKETRLSTTFPFRQPRKHFFNPVLVWNYAKGIRPKKGKPLRRGWLSPGPRPKLHKVCFDSGPASKAGKPLCARPQYSGHPGPRHHHVLRAAVPQVCISGWFARARIYTRRVLLGPRVRDLLRLSERQNSVRSRRAPTFDPFSGIRPEGVRVCRARLT